MIMMMLIIRAQVAETRGWGVVGRGGWGEGGGASVPVIDPDGDEKN